MKLTYRGVQYSERDSQLSAADIEYTEKEIIYRGNSRLGKIKPSFPLWQYVRQLAQGSESQPIFNPITFWYSQKREFIESCWHLDNREKLALVWSLTIRMERAKLKPKQQVKLKYRGIEYYK